MSWTPDESTSDPANESFEAPAPEAALPEMEAPVIESAAPVGESEVAAKPRRRRAPRSQAPVETEAPVVEVAATPEPAPMETPPARRRGRRQATGDPGSPPTAVSPATETAAETPAADAPPPARRRGRRQATGEAPGTLPAVEASDQGAAAPTVTPTRRRGRRTAAADLPPETLVEAAGPAESGPTPRDAEPTPTRQRGRRRATPPKAEPGTAPALDALVLSPPPSLPEGKDQDVQAETAEETATLTDGETTSEEGEARGRKRSRRGRRRRGQDDVIMESVELTETGMTLPELVDTAEPEEEDTFFVAPLPTPVYVAPPLVPRTQTPPDGARLPPTPAALAHDPKTGAARIVLGGRDYAPYFFFVNAEEAERGETVDAQIGQAAAVGVHLFSSVMYLPLKNAYGDRSFGAADAFVQQALAADPEAYLMPRLQFVPTNFWVRTHPEQVARYADGTEGDVSLASSEFWADCVDALEALIAHFADPSTPGGDRVIGFHLDRGEWFHDAQSGPDVAPLNREAFQHWLQAKYQAPYALRAAWYNGAVTFDEAEIPLPMPAGGKADGKKGGVPLYAGMRDGRWVDYALYSSEIVAQVITGLAAAVKTLSAGRLLVAVSYGYTLEFATRGDSGHLAMAQVLRSPDIDIVAGPNTYAGRGAGGTGAFGALVDSVALHGKLWLVEDDTKTFLAEGETPDTYNPKITGGAETQAAHQRTFGAALAHGAGVTWMDLWGQGWLDSPDIWQELGGLRDQARLWEKITPGKTSPDVAVLVDEASLAYAKSDSNGLSQNLVAKTRDLLLRTGASVGFYLQSDVTHADFPDAKLYLFVNALRVTTAERQAIREKLQTPGKTLAWLYAPAMFDEKGAATQESSELVGMALRLQPWNARLGSQTTEIKHAITERLRSSRRVGVEEIVNPSYAVTDPQATVLAEYIGNGAPSLAVREHPEGWRSVFIGDPHLSVELLRGLYAYAGVPLYDTQDDIVYASGDGVLLVHTAFNGQRTLNLPQRATVYDAMEQKIVASDSRTFRAFLRARTTRRFLWGERAAVQAATGLSLPSAAETADGPDPAATIPLPPPPETLVPTALPFSEPAAEIAARYERQQQDEDEDAAQAKTTLHVTDLAAVLDMKDDDTAFLDTSEMEAEANAATTEGGENRPRSRWQRRRAAARARRDAERETQNGGGVSADADAAAPPLDISIILPGLPPRRPFEPEPKDDEN